MSVKYRTKTQLAMRQVLLSILCITLYFNALAQNYDWVQSEKIDFQQNPSYISYPVAFDKVNGRVIAARPDIGSFIYNQDLYGTTFLESRDSNGVLLWQLEMGPNVSVQELTCDDFGNYYVAGVMDEELILGSNDTIPFFNITVSTKNNFIFQIDASGQIGWKRNVSPQWPSYNGIQGLAASPSGDVWYAMTDFFHAKIVRLDASGNDTQIRTIDNGKTIGAIAFDPWGGMFISGSAEEGDYIMDGSSWYAPHDYNMSLAYYTPAGVPGWALFGHDITFQHPIIATDDFGNVFFTNNIYDSTTFGGIFFHNPLPAADFMAFKADTSGQVLWGVQQPPLLIGPFGKLEVGLSMSADADASGNFYLAGSQNGSVDWGNGLISVLPNYTDRRIAVAKISPSGSAQWVKLGGSNGYNAAQGVAVSPGGSCYFTGVFSDSAYFDSIFFPTTNFTNSCIGKIFDSGFTGIEENETDEVLIYPNPASHQIILPVLPAAKIIKLYDAVGRMVKQQKYSDAPTMNVENIPTGIYFLNFEKNGIAVTRKIVKM